MEFTSGQKLTAADLNSVVQLAKGQNIPTDGSFINTNQGVNYYSNMAAKPEGVKRPQVFNVGIRYHNIESDNNRDPVYLPFWYIYLGKDSEDSSVVISSLKVDAGNGLKMSNISTTYVQPMPDSTLGFQKLKDFAYKNAIVQFLGNEDFDPANLAKFDPAKVAGNRSQYVSSTGEGWFCTGLPAATIDGERFSWTQALFTKEIYATFVRIDSTGNPTSEYNIAMVITNAPINNVSQLFLDYSGNVTLPSGYIKYCELLGGHSQKIASLDTLRAVGSSIIQTNMYPTDSMKKEFDHWELITPPVTPYNSVDKDQVNKYQFVNMAYIDYDGEYSEIVLGEDDDDTQWSHITFSKLESTSTPIGVYYAALENDRDYDKGETDIYRLKKYAINNASVQVFLSDLTRARDNIDIFSTLAWADAIQRVTQKKTVLIRPICLFLVNKNDHPDDPNLWSIVHTAYINRIPDFAAFLYDTKYTLGGMYDDKNRYHCSLERIDVQLQNDNVPKCEMTYDQLYRFNENGYKLTSLNNLSAEVVVRQHSMIEGQPADLINYVDLSTILSGISELSGTSCSADSEIQSLNLSSIGVLQNDNGKVYELYNFDKMRTDINAHIMPVGSMLPGKFGKVGKLLDQNDNELTAVDIVARDKDTHEVKYLNFTVDETFADTDVGAAAQASLEFKQDAAGLMTYAQLYDFQKCPADTLSATINNNGIVNITDDNTWMLTKTYNPINQRLELQYKHLALSVDLSAVQADSISGDTNAIAIRKSIDTKQQGNVKYHQLHNFDNPNPTTKTVDMQAKNTAYDTLDSNEYFVIKSGDEVKYKKVQIKDNTPGGGTTSGYTGSVVGDCRLKWNTRGTYKIELWGKDMTYENGLLKTVGNERLVSELDTVGYSGQ